MRVFFVLFAALALVGCGQTAKRQSTSPVANASLRLVDGDGVELRGRGFERRERVRVELLTRRRWSATVAADDRGAFSVRFPRAETNACEAFAATAIGNRGSRASFKRAPGECPVP